MDSSLYFYSHRGIQAFCLIYVDDLILISSSTAFASHIIQLLGQQFSIKDLSTLHHFLGIEATFTKSIIFLTQSKYLVDLLAKANMSSANGVSTPFCSNNKLSLHKGNVMSDATLY